MAVVFVRIRESNLLGNSLKNKKMAFIPNTTPTPNWLYNGEMKKMNETELKVVLLVTRQTLGWYDPMTKGRKEQDYISQSQFKMVTGQYSAAIARAIQTCIEHGWIIARDKTGMVCDTPKKRARHKIWYQLGGIFTDKISGSESELDGKTEISSGSESEPNLVRKANSTKETLNKEYYVADATAPPPLVWSYENELKKIKDQGLPHLKIVAFFFFYKGFKFENKEQFNQAIPRHVKEASLLAKAFKEEQIFATMRYFKKEMPGVDWTLSAVRNKLPWLISNGFKPPKAKFRQSQFDQG